MKAFLPWLMVAGAVLAILWTVSSKTPAARAVQPEWEQVTQ